MTRKCKRGAKRPFLFWKLSLSFSVLVLAPLMMGIITYALTYQALLGQAKQSNMALAQNAMTLVENSLSSVDDLAALLGTDKKVGSLLQTPASRRQNLVYSMSTLKEELPAIKDSNHLIDGYFIYSLENSSIIAPKQGFLDISLYYDRYCQYGDWDFSRWEREVLKTDDYRTLLPARRMKYGPEWQSTLLYPYPVRHAITQRIIGTILFRVNSDRVRALMTPESGSESNRVFIFNKKGDMLISTDAPGSELPEGLAGSIRGTAGFNQVIGGIPMFVSACESEKQDLLFAVATPLSEIRKQSADVLKTIVVSLAVLYTGSVFLAAYLFGRQHGTLMRIADKLAAKRIPDSMRRYDGIRYIDDGISGLLDDNADLSAKVQQQKLQITSILFSRLVNGGFQDHAALRKFIQHTGITVEGNRFRGVYLVFKEKDLSVQLQAVLETIAQYDKLIPYASADETNRFSILYQEARTQSPAGPAAVGDLFSNIYRTLADVYRLETVLYIGYACDDLLYINQSFASASQLIDMHSNDASDSHFLYIAKRPSDHTRYRYSVQDQQKLANLILVSDLEGIDRLLDSLYKENFERQNLSGPMQELLYAQLAGTLLSCSGEAALQREVESLLHLERPREFLERIREQCHAVSREIRRSNEAHTAQGMEEIRRYINGHFAQNDLSLSYIALKYHMSESHLSISIKNYLGQNFQNYVEQLRINRANELMQTTALSIQEISERVGYLSPHSFRRAYKRMMGQTPSQFSGR